MARRKKPINKKLLIGVGIASALIGTYFLAGDQIKSLFKKDDTDKKPEDQQPQLPPAVVPGTPGTPAPVGSGVKNAPQDTGYDINKKLRVGSKGEEVKRLQFIINSIAGARQTNSYTDAGKKVNFPINPDGDFGNNTNLGSLFSFDIFKSQGYITLDQARKKMAYIFGYRQLQFPSSFVGTKNEKQYQESYKAGQIDFGKADRAKNIGAFVNPLNP
jgi:hypothetical protein